MVRSKHPVFSAGKIKVHTSGYIKKDGKPVPTSNPLNDASSISVAGDSIEIGSGTFTLNANLVLKTGMSLIGSGFGSTVIATNGFKLELDALNDVHISSLTVDATSSTNGVTLDNNCARITFENVKVVNATGDGVYSTAGGMLRFSGCYFDTNGGDGLSLLEIGSVAGLTASGAAVNDCYFRNNVGSGLKSDKNHDDVYQGLSFEDNGNAGIYVVDPIQIIISGCALERNNELDDVGNTWGDVTIDFATSFGNDFHVTITGCHFAAPLQERNIRINNTSTMDSVVNITGNTFSAFEFAISCGDLRPTTSLLISSNVFIAKGHAADERPAIVLVAESGVVAADVKIQGNTFRPSVNLLGGDLTGVKVSDITDVNLTNNHFVGLTSAIIANDGATFIGSGNEFDGNTTDLDITGTAALATAYSLTRSLGDVNNEASGTATILSGGTSIAVTHGLSQTPAAGDVIVTALENPTNTPGAIWVDTYTSTQFTINCENDPGASNLDVAWQAHMHL